MKKKLLRDFNLGRWGKLGLMKTYRVILLGQVLTSFSCSFGLKAGATKKRFIEMSKSEVCETIL